MLPILPPRWQQKVPHVHIVTPLLTGGQEQEAVDSHLFISRVPPISLDRSRLVPFVDEMNTALEAHARALGEEQGPFDLIHTHDWLTARAGVALKHAWHRPLLATIHCH
ncbi:MAG: hypothetical protein KatS3mg057_3092 [Herpetosiphonaceae bacterium]|nr:MAG: hypothetical protein KatS3mg057_3092 [Herpetosiphonaceae bacterium]